MKKTMISTAVLALLFASCSSDDGLTQSTLPLEGTPIQVNVAVADLQTRAGYDDSNLPSQFYMNVVHPDENSKYTYKALMKNEENVWKSYDAANQEPVQMLWAGDDKQVNVTAATFSLANTIIDLGVETDQSSADKVLSCDHLLMPTTSVAPSENGIDVSLSHLMSKLKLVIELKNEFDVTENPISDLSINGTLPKRNYNWGTVAENDSRWSNISDVDEPVSITSIAPLFNSFKAAEEKTRASGEYEAILVPQTITSGDFNISFKVNDRKFSWTSIEDINLESGTEYTLTLTAGKDKVSSASFSASTWNPGNSISGKTE